MGDSEPAKYVMSGKRRRMIVWGIIILAGALVVVDRGFLRDSGGPGTKQTNQSSDIQKYHQKTFTVVNVVDGDTLDIGAPDGEYDHTRIRLWGIDTPEMRGNNGAAYYAEKATQFAETLAFGKEVKVCLDRGNRTRGYYGRLLAYVFLSDGRCLNEVLVGEGYAYADLRFNHSYYNKYKKLQSSARRADKGLWEQVSQEQLPDWLKEKRPELLK